MLKGLRVVDAGVYLVGPGATALLGSLGADVIRIEPPQLDGLYHFADRQGGVSICYICANFSKRNIILNLKEDKDRQTALRLVESADILVENHLPGVMDKLGLAYEIASKVNPSIIYCSCPAYGARGPLAGLAAADPYVQAATGLAGITGAPGSNGEIFRNTSHADWTASINIVQGVLLALIARERTGEGQRVDTSAFEANLAIQVNRAAEYFATGQTPEILGSASPYIVPSQAFLTLDKRYINVSVPGEAYWPRLCRALGLEELENDPRFKTNENRVKNRGELIPVLKEKFATAPARWWQILLQRHDIPCGHNNTLDDILCDPHIRENDMIVTRQTPWGEVLFGGIPISFSQCQGDVDLKGTVAPDHNREEILSELSEKKAGPRVSPASGTGSLKKPLEGIKVLDLSEEIAGPFCAMELSDAGADVIKVEPFQGDWSRSLGIKVKGESVLFMSVNRGKRSLAVDYTSESGKGLVRRLIEKADILVESFRPGDADKMGLGYEDARRLNPKIIFASITPFGTKGPHAARAATELELQGLAGYPAYLGEPGGEPVRSGADFAAMDGAQFAFIGILAALYHRYKTGVGQKVEVSMLGALLNMGQYWMAAQYNPDNWDGFFASGATDHTETGYRVKDGSLMLGDLGEARPDQEKMAFAGFVKKIGLGHLLDDPWWAEHGHTTVRRAVGRESQKWHHVYEKALASRTVDEVVEIVTSVGGRVAIIKNYKEVFNEPQVQAVEMVAELNHPVAGNMKTTGLPFKLAKTPCRIKGPAPTLGQHTDEILASLGYSDKEIARLKKQRVVA